MAKSMETGEGKISDPAGRRAPGRVLLDSTSEGLLDALMFTFRFVGWLTRWTLATVFFIAVMAFAAYFVFNELVKGGGYVNVPDIVGLNITKASNELASVGLEIGSQNLVPSHPDRVQIEPLP